MGKENSHVSGDVISRSESGFGGEIESATNFSRKGKMIGNFESETGGEIGVRIVKIGV